MVKFPCGYEYRLSIKTGFFGMGSFESKMPKECPLHGKNCKKQ